MRFLASLLIALAMLVSPIAMTGGGAAMAHGGVAAAAAAGHCAGTETPDEGDRGGATMDCMSACSAVPAAAAAMAARIDPPKITSIAARPRALAGLPPESATPPPRSS